MEQVQATTVPIEPERACMFEAFVTNLGRYNEGALVGKWVKFPLEPGEMAEVFRRIGIDGVRYEEYFITDYESYVGGLTEHLGEYESLNELNYLASLYMELEPYGQQVFEAALELGDYTSDTAALINLTQNLSCYDLLADVDGDYDLGYYWVEESGCYDVKSMGSISSYIDYERFGRDIRLDEGGIYSDHGYIRNTYDDFIEHCDGQEVPEEYRAFYDPDSPEQDIFRDGSGPER